MNHGQHSVSAAQPGLAVGRIKQIITAAQPFPEQRAIAAFLDAETTRIDSLIAEAEKAIELLRESRTALISDAVTGKIDVRDWQQECA